MAKNDKVDISDNNNHKNETVNKSLYTSKNLNGFICYPTTKTK